MKKAIEYINAAVKVIKTFMPLIAAISVGVAAFTAEWDNQSKLVK